MTLHSILSLAVLVTVAALTAARASAQPPAPAGDTLSVRLTGIPAASGQILVAVYASAESWLDTAEVAHYAFPDALAGEQIVRIPGVAPGRYAVAVVHDADSSGDITTGFFGIPEEAYGFSNDARGRLGPPDFDEAVVEWGGAGEEVLVRVKKFGS